MSRSVVGVVVFIAVAWGGAFAQQAAPGVGSDGGAVDPAAAPAATAFQRELAALGSGAVVEGCTMVVDVGPQQPGGPSSHGGVCLVNASGKPLRVLMCDTDGVGGFALTTTFTATEAAVREFVTRVCPRG